MQEGRALPARRAADRRPRDTGKSLRPEGRVARRPFRPGRSSLPHMPHIWHPIRRRAARAIRRVVEFETVFPLAGSCAWPAPAADSSRPATSETRRRWWPHRDRVLLAESTARESPDRSPDGRKRRSAQGVDRETAPHETRWLRTRRRAAATRRPPSRRFCVAERRRSIFAARRSATTPRDLRDTLSKASRSMPMRTPRTTRLRRRPHRACALRAARRVCRSCAARPHPPSLVLCILARRRVPASVCVSA